MVEYSLLFPYVRTILKLPSNLHDTIVGPLISLTVFWVVIPLLKCYAYSEAKRAPSKGPLLKNELDSPWKSDDEYHKFMY